jgi:hypothetical protein
MKNDSDKPRKQMNRAGSINVVATCFATCVITLFRVACADAAQSDFKHLYSYYFPKQSQDVRSVYRRYFDKLLFGAPPPKSEVTRASQVYYAARGEAAAFHAFVHNRDWGVEGAPGEECVYESVLLLLCLGDDRFSQLLAREDAKTRKKIGYAIDPQVDWDKHAFPKTRALYSYRYVPPSEHHRNK